MPPSRLWLCFKVFTSSRFVLLSSHPEYSGQEKKKKTILIFISIFFPPKLLLRQLNLMYIHQGKTNIIVIVILEANTNITMTNDIILLYTSHDNLQRETDSSPGPADVSISHHSSALLPNRKSSPG